MQITKIKSISKKKKIKKKLIKINKIRSIKQGKNHQVNNKQIKRMNI